MDTPTISPLGLPPDRIKPMRPVTQSTSTQAAIASQLVGVWKLVSYSDEQAGREDLFPFGPEPEGFLIYTHDGFVSAQLMKPGRSLFQSNDWHAGTPAEHQQAGSGYIAYCGAYEVDEERKTVTHNRVNEARPASKPTFLAQPRIGQSASEGSMRNEHGRESFSNLPMTVKDAARFLGVSPQTVYLWVERKQIPHFRVMGRNIRFLKSDLKPFRAQFKQEVENGKTAYT